MKQLQTKRYGKSALINLHAYYMATLGKKVIIYTSSSDHRRQVENEFKLYNPDFISKGLITVKTTNKGKAEERRKIMTRLMICPKSKECNNSKCHHKTKHDLAGFRHDVCVERGDWNGEKCPPCVPYYEVGDRVVVVNPGVGGDNLNKGEVCRITSMSSPDSCRLKSESRLDQRWWLSPVDFESVPEDNMTPKHKVGDTVRVTTEYDSSYMIWSMRRYLGQELKIARFEDGAPGNEPWIILEDNAFVWKVRPFAYSWKAKDLEIIEKAADAKPQEPEYKVLKPLTLSMLIAESRIDIDEVGRLAEWINGQGYGSRSVLAEITGFLDYAKQHECFWDFLIDNGYVKEVMVEEPEVFYGINDRFSCDGENGILAQCSIGAVVMISFLTGNRQKNPVAVHNVNKITQEELDAICGSSEWTKIND